MNDNSNWTKFYMEFADKLLEYKDNRTELIQKLKNIYEKIDFVWSIFDRNSHDIDPFTVFALFNRQLTDENRTIIIEKIKKEFSIESDIPTNFIGIPLVNNRSSTFFDIYNEGGSIDNLWNLFENALRFSTYYDDESRNNFIFYYNEIIKRQGIKWSITVALFWIRPFVFVSLDNKNRKFLSSELVSLDSATKLILKEHLLPSGEDYLQICDNVYFSLKENNYFENFEGLSHYANISKEENKSMENISCYEEEHIMHDNVDYWVFAPGENAYRWDEQYKEGIMAIGWDIGDIRNFKNKEQINERLQKLYNDNANHVNIRTCLWDLVHRVKIGDIIFAKRGTNEIIGRGIVESDYFYDENREEYRHIRKVKWTHKGNWPYGDTNDKLPNKTLTNITNISYNPKKLKTIKGFFKEDSCKYTKENFLNEAYISEEDYGIIVKLLENKKNLILQGAPGVGKTFISKRLVYSLIGSKCEDRFMMVQFHQSYSYEDFVEGYRPTEKNFNLEKGSFYNFCKKAINDKDNNYFFIIDEINRGNLSKIFGELFMLIENDKRGEKVQLLYSNEEFYIPENLYIIGLMNTADRSIAMIDYALRRRFAFFDLKPGFSSSGFEDYQSTISNNKFDRIIDVMKELNAAIKDDETLGEGFRIGHSFFCNLSVEDVEEKLNYIVEYEIIPLLKEYWFDEPDKVNEWSEKLRNSLNE